MKEGRKEKIQPEIEMESYTFRKEPSWLLQDRMFFAFGPTAMKTFMIPSGGQWIGILYSIEDVKICIERASNDVRYFISLTHCPHEELRREELRNLQGQDLSFLFLYEYMTLN